MAQIVTITNPLTGQPAQVDQLEHTAQQIDDGIARALPGGEIDITLQNKVNPNILDNPWFQVNQRGQTTYSTAYAYTVDRWKMDDPYMKLDINDDGTITLSETVDGNRDLSQYFEEDVLTSLLNKTLTASILFQDGQLFSTTFNAPSSVLTRWFTLNIPSKNLKIFMDTAGEKVRFSIRLIAIGSHAIKAVKLEVGAISTLANDIPPNYAQELAKCQRYFYRIEDLYTAGVYEQMGGNHLAVQTIYFPVTMRTEPSFTFGVAYYRNGGSWTALTSTSRYGVDSKKQYSVPSFDVDNLTSQYSYIMRLSNIQFSADL